MKRSEIKVGETYAIQTKQGAEPVAAKVLDVDAPYTYEAWRGHEITEQGGGILVEFAEPVCHSFGELHARSTRGTLRPDPFTRLTFGPKDRRFPQAGRIFIGLWADYQAEKRAEKRKLEDERARLRAAADAFEPILRETLRKLAAIGDRPEVYDDASGISGEIDITLRTYERRAVGFGWMVSMRYSTFEKLLDAAVTAGVTIGQEDDDDDDA